MSTILEKFLASRAARQPVTNESQPVTREEFNTLARAVEGLVQDVEAALSPEQLGKALNAALEPLVNAAPKGAGGKFTAPAADDDATPGTAVTNKFTAPAGE